jgi:DNA-directed RNA polymerase subunit RPC12/RpoP
MIAALMEHDSAAPDQPNAEAQSFRCDTCGADMSFDADRQTMLCGHCGHTVDVGTEGNYSIVEYDLEHGLALAAQRGFGAEVRTTQCQECGATVSFGDNTTSTACEFCGSAQVLEQREKRNVIRPESLVPFQVGREIAGEKFSGWLRGLWFRPSKLKHQARVTEMAGVYVPYWSFDARVDSRWRAQAGYYYYVNERYTTRDSQGKTVTRNRRVRRTRWVPARGQRTDAHQDVLVCASRGLPEDLAERLRTFDARALQPYTPAFLAGWRAEEYAVELNDGWGRAVQKMEREQTRRCARDVPGDTHQFLRVDNRFYDEKFKHVLLPVWISSYRYHEKVYRFLVNGQTGEVTGKAPWSVFKIVSFILFLIALVTAIVLLVQRGGA